MLVCEFCGEGVEVCGLQGKVVSLNVWRKKDEARVQVGGPRIKNAHKVVPLGGLELLLRALASGSICECEKVEWKVR